MLNKLKLLLGLAVVVTGLTAGFYSLDARSDATNELRAEHIITASDSDIPEVAVDDMKTAVAQANVIKKHILERTGGKTYAEMDRDDPNRETYTQSVVLRTSLFAAALAIGVANLALVLSGLMIALGLLFTAESYTALRGTALKQ